MPFTWSSCAGIHFALLILKFIKFTSIMQNIVNIFFNINRHRHKTYKILNIHQNCLNLWNMILFWFFGAYIIEICGKLGMRMKFVSRHVECRTFFDCFTILWKNNECFQIHHNFQLAYILSFQKRYICPKKILDIKKLFKKMWPQILLFPANFDFELNFLMKFLKFHIRISVM